MINNNLEPQNKIQSTLLSDIMDMGDTHLTWDHVVHRQINISGQELTIQEMSKGKRMYTYTIVSPATFTYNDIVYESRNYIIKKPSPLLMDKQKYFSSIVNDTLNHLRMNNINYPKIIMSVNSGTKLSDCVWIVQKIEHPMDLANLSEKVTKFIQRLVQLNGDSRLLLDLSSDNIRLDEEGTPYYTSCYRSSEDSKVSLIASSVNDLASGNQALSNNLTSELSDEMRQKVTLAQKQMIQYKQQQQQQMINQEIQQMNNNNNNNENTRNAS